MLDIFKSSAFGVVPLTDAINELLFVPGRLGRMGLFSTTGITTTSVAIENKNGVLMIIAPTPRGGPGHTLEKPKRRMRQLSVPHFEINDAVMAEEVQGVRAWGDETATETVQGKITERNAETLNSFAATEEFARVGAVKGVITYADGTETDLFDEFGVTQEAELEFDLQAGSPASGVLRKRCAAVTRQMAGILGGVPFTGVHAIVGDDFFDDLIAHKEVRETYLQQQEASQLRTGYVDGGAGGSFGSFNFGGITWENYRGEVGNTKFVNDDAAHFFPTGVPGLFKTVYAPADYIETVNTKGKRLYQKQWPMPNDKGVNLDTQMNALNFCTRPRVLLKGTRAA